MNRYSLIVKGHCGERFVHDYLGPVEHVCTIDHAKSDFLYTYLELHSEYDLTRHLNEWFCDRQTAPLPAGSLIHWANKVLGRVAA